MGFIWVLHWVAYAITVRRPCPKPRENDEGQPTLHLASYQWPGPPMEDPSVWWCRWLPVWARCSFCAFQTETICSSSVPLHEVQPMIKLRRPCADIVRAKLARATSWNPHKNYGGYAGACRLGWYKPGIIFITSCCMYVCCCMADIAVKKSIYHLNMEVIFVILHI